MGTSSFGRPIRPQPMELAAIEVDRRDDIGPFDSQRKYPDWRHQVGRQLMSDPVMEKVIKTDRYADRMVMEQMLPFLRLWHGRGSSDHRAEMRRYWSEMEWAFRIHEGEEPDRYALESMVMSGIDVADIAKTLKVEVRVVQLYELSFFDVRPMLDSEMWIWMNVLRPARNKAKCLEDYFWKAMGYRSPGQLDILSKLITFWKPSEEVNVEIRGLIAYKMTCDALDTAMRREPGKFNSIETFEFYAKLIELNKDDEKTLSEYEKSMETLLKQLIDNGGSLTADDEAPKQLPVFEERNLGAAEAAKRALILD